MIFVPVGYVLVEGPGARKALRMRGFLGFDDQGAVWDDSLEAGWNQKRARQGWPFETSWAPLAADTVAE
jgi:hypothetical protein